MPDARDFKLVFQQAADVKPWLVSIGKKVKRLNIPSLVGFAKVEAELDYPASINLLPMDMPHFDSQHFVGTEKARERDSVHQQQHRSLTAKSDRQLRLGGARAGLRTGSSCCTHTTVGSAAMLLL
jgi:hypothetical protein